MNTNTKLEQEISEYAQIAKENKNIDVAALMMNALQRDESNKVPAKSKRWAYIISLGFPPFGLLYALKYYFSDKSDAKSVANVCIVLTGVALLGLWIFSKLLLSGSGASLEQIQQIKPQDIQELYQ